MRCLQNFVTAMLAACAAAATTTARADSLRLLVQNGYLPQLPVLVRVELLRPDGGKNRNLWDTQAILTVDQPGVTLSTNRVLLRNGAGSGLVTFSGGGDFNLTATVDTLWATRPLRSLTKAPVTAVGGTLTGSATTWAGVVLVTNDLTVPTAHTLTVQSNTLVLVSGVASGTAAPDLVVNGTLRSLGTESQPVVITCANPGLRWGQIRHNNAQPSVYRYTVITLAGRGIAEGHTGTTPAIRLSDSKVTFESCTISDLADSTGTPGKVLFSPGGQALGSEVTFNDCLFARARMGPEVQETSLLCTNTWIMEMRGPDDADGIYLHNQKPGQPLLLTGCVIAGGDDDGIDTLDSTIRVENTIIRDWLNTAEDAKGISVFNGETTVDRCLVVNCFAGISAKSSGPLARVNIDRCTVIAYTNGLVAAFKSNATAGNIDFRVTNSIMRAQVSVRSDFSPTNFHIGYCNLREAWPGTGNFSADPYFVIGWGNDFHLAPGSPCIDTGNPASPPDPDGSRADVGALPFDLAALAPAIISSPKSQTVVAGGCATFEVAAAGWLPFGYEWRHNGVRIIDHTNQLFIVCGVRPSDAGEYVVVLSNSGGVVTSSPPAVLTVLVPPQITKQPQNRIVLAGDNVAFDVATTGTPPLSYQWISNNVVIAGATNISLTLSNVTLANNRDSFRVAVSNAASSVTSDPAILSVVGPPQLTQPLSRPDGTFQLELASDGTRTYEILATADFLQWEVLFALANTNGLVEWRDTNSVGHPYRFYRVRSAE